MAKLVAESYGWRPTQFLPQANPLPGNRVPGAAEWAGRPGAGGSIGEVATMDWRQQLMNISPARPFKWKHETRPYS